MNSAYAPPLAHSETTTITEAIRILQELEEELEGVSKEMAATRRRLLTLAEERAAAVSAMLLEKADALAEEMVKKAVVDASVREKEILSQVEKDLSHLRKKIETAKDKAVLLVMDALTSS
jgi:vacuolar-type H+-ATPase subunit H